MSLIARVQYMHLRIASFYISRIASRAFIRHILIMWDTLHSFFFIIYSHNVCWFIVTKIICLYVNLCVCMVKQISRDV